MKKTLGITKVLCSLLLTLTVLIGVMPATKVSANPRDKVHYDPKIKIIYLNDQSFYYWNGNVGGSADYVVMADVYFNPPKDSYVTRVDGAIVNNNQYVIGPFSKTFSKGQLPYSTFRIGTGNANIYWPFYINQLDPNKLYTLQVGITYSDGSEDHFSREISIKKMWPIKCSKNITLTHNGFSVIDVPKGDKLASIGGKFESTHPIIRVDVAVWKGDTLIAVLRIQEKWVMNPDISQFQIGKRLGLSNYPKGNDYSITVTAMDSSFAYATSSRRFAIT